MESPPYPSLADALWLMFYPPVYLGLFLLLRARGHRFRCEPVPRRDDRRAGGGRARDGDRALERPRRRPRAETAAVITNLAYPIADTVLLALVAVAFALTAWRPDPSWLLLALGSARVRGRRQHVPPSDRHGHLRRRHSGRPRLGDLSRDRGLCRRRPRTPARLVQPGLAMLAVPVLFAGLAPRSARLGSLRPRARRLAVPRQRLRAHRDRAHGADLPRERRHAARANPRGGDRRPDGPSQPPATAERPRASRSTRRTTRSSSRSSTSTASSSTTTCSATRPVTRSCDASAATLADAVGDRGDAPTGWAATSSACSPSRARRNGAGWSHDAVHSLSEEGGGFTVSAAHGVCRICPRERPGRRRGACSSQTSACTRTRTPIRASATEQSSNVLLAALLEHDPDLGDHVRGVAELAVELGRALDVEPSELETCASRRRCTTSANSRSPRRSSRKPGPLDDEEWAFIRTHTVIGERIVRAAPSLAPASELIRSSHERFDGTGYPDGLRAERHPPRLAHHRRLRRLRRDALRAALLALEERVRAALEELRRNAGTQFDPEAVAAFRTIIAQRAEIPGLDLDPVV